MFGSHKDDATTAQHANTQDAPKPGLLDMVKGALGFETAATEQKEPASSHSAPAATGGAAATMPGVSGEAGDAGATLGHASSESPSAAIASGSHIQPQLSDPQTRMSELSGGQEESGTGAFPLAYTEHDEAQLEHGAPKVISSSSSSSSEEALPAGGQAGGVAATLGLQGTSEIPADTTPRMEGFTHKPPVKYSSASDTYGGMDAPGQTYESKYAALEGERAEQGLERPTSGGSADVHGTMSPIGTVPGTYDSVYPAAAADIPATFGTAYSTSQGESDVRDAGTVPGTYDSVYPAAAADTSATFGTAYPTSQGGSDVRDAGTVPGTYDSVHPTAAADTPATFGTTYSTSQGGSNVRDTGITDIHAPTTHVPATYDAAYPTSRTSAADVLGTNITPSSEAFKHTNQQSIPPAGYIAPHSSAAVETVHVAPTTTTFSGAGVMNPSQTPSAGVAATGTQGTPHSTPAAHNSTEKKGMVEKLAEKAKGMAVKVQEKIHHKK